MTVWILVLILLWVSIMATEIIIKVKKGKHKHYKLGAKYSINNFKIITTMATIQIPGDKNSVSGTLIPLDANNNPLNLSFLQADTDTYASSDEAIGVAAKTGNGTFTVSRVSASGGTIEVKYGAINAKGNSISGSDTIVFDAVPVVQPEAASLTASYSEPV
jgi:hypothetical protein